LGKSKADRIAAAAARLRELYAAGGCLRVPNDARRRGGGRKYKHGHELRFAAWDESESAEILRLLRVVSVEAGRLYLKRGRPVIPVYGKQRVLRAIRDLRLKRPLPKARKRRVAEPRQMPRTTTRWQGTTAITSVRQLDVVGLLDNQGPLAAGELSTTGRMLTLLEKRGLTEPVPADGRQPTRWRLTRKGGMETRRARKSYLDWMRALPPD